MIVLDIKVLGTPVPQGSLKHIGGGRIVDSSPKVRPQRKLLSKAMREGYDYLTFGERQGGACKLFCEFVFERPKFHYTSKGDLTSSAPEFKTTAPDTDKLLRLCGDAVTDAGIWLDDAQAVSSYGQKRYNEPGEPAHTRIVIVSITDEPAAHTRANVFSDSMPA